MLAKYGIEVFVTTDEKRDGNTDVKLTPRATRANEYVKTHKKKGVFISIHANAHGNGSEWTTAKGWSAYTTKGQNVSDKLSDCIYDFAEKIFVNDKMSIRTDKYSDGDRDYEENFTVIFAANMPAVLIENFFYTNINDTTYLLSEIGQQHICDVILQGILKFADMQYKM